MQDELKSACERVKLQKRTRAATQVETWMEVYEDVTDDFEAMLVGMVERHGLAALTGDRHVEHFVDVASPESVSHDP